MRFPKSKIVFLVLCCTTNFYTTYGQGILSKTQIDSTLNNALNTKKINRLVENDSLYNATLLLNDAISFSKKHNLKEFQANTYILLGEVLTRMSNYQHAENYLLKAYNILDSLGNRKEKSRVLSSMAKTYLSAKSFKKFDSVYTKAQKLSKELNSELYFVNLNHKIKKNYYKQASNTVLDVSSFAINTIEQTDFKNLNFSKHYENKDLLKAKLLKSYKYHKAIAQIKVLNFEPDGFNLLFKINEEKLTEALKNDPDGYRKLATFNYYKYVYYNDATRNLDSANKYLLKSDSYKYEALNKFEKRNAKNGELIYKIISTEQQLDLANKVRSENAKSSQILLYTTILVSIFLFGTLVIFYFYRKAKRKIQRMNKALKNSNKKLIDIDKNRSEFFSVLSHELRTPIYGISGLATLIDQEENEEKRQSYLDSLISSSNYLSILIDNTLQANKLRFEKKKLRLKPDKIKRIVTHVLSTVEVAAKNKGLQIITNIDDSDENEFVMIDKVAFSQILINLAFNAVRYTKEGKITINVFEKKRTPQDVTLRFEVNDTGIGIKEEHRSVVFHAFENKTFLHKNSSGSGLGLHIVKTLLKSHSSTIDFTSEVNLGTSFFFEIKFALAASPAKSNPIKIASNANKHILIVDDNKVNLLITKKNVEKLDGYSCETMSRGREAISLIKEKAFDLVLMDINMPDMDGFEVTKHIRMFNKSIPILALTALNSSEISLKAESIGINQIITKPYIFEDFKATIFAYLERNDNYLRPTDKEAI